MNLDWLAVIVFGLPAALLSLCLAAIAIFLRRPSVLLVAALMAVPFGFYLTANPNFRVLGPVSVGGFILASLALRRRHVLAAILLTVPFIAVTIWLLILVFSQLR